MQVDATGGSATYGECMPEGITSLLRHIPLQPDDVFVVSDLHALPYTCLSMRALVVERGAQPPRPILLLPLLASASRPSHPSLFPCKWQGTDLRRPRVLGLPTHRTWAPGWGA